MLAVRRPGVTEALQALTRRGFLSQTRGRIVIVDRDGLVERAGGFYGVPEAEYERLLGASDLTTESKTRYGSGLKMPVQSGAVPRFRRGPNPR